MRSPLLLLRATLHLPLLVVQKHVPRRPPQPLLRQARWNVNAARSVHNQAEVCSCSCYIKMVQLREKDNFWLLLPLTSDARASRTCHFLCRSAKEARSEAEPPERVQA